MFRVVIPARYGSARLPGKVLLTIAGKPMIQWVYERARASRAREVLIATDDLLIVSAAHSFGAQAIMTAPTHRSGTDRIAEVARLQRWADPDIIVNVQGDEPLIPAALIDQVGAMLESNPGAQIATLATPIRSISEFMDPNAVKVVTDGEGRALYFSRAPIPWDRDGAAAGVVSQKSFSGARRHVGIYGYRVGGLLRLAALQPSPLEQQEKLEQLRALENGLEIRVADSVAPPGPDVNTAADLEQVSALLRR
ncbi:MAG: 3-deoxy-manno-octulosonate cytidylyltransferase [Gammaproteobacteria bacterium]|jgi:3-deoxy-manno-octulosonate cytidylyltransferase (CMP-KDO synthetase)|nr:3-deoxy-manno-octulosonate cytidylyltransferase [Gammaproteobacteria bacterium]HEV7443568.1 3-deoxy-manno-octulosonate cytidylyltransferase [Steroidobacteraceae bacterium]